MADLAIWLDERQRADKFEAIDLRAVLRSSRVPRRSLRLPRAGR
jgi:hypothetical protein